MAITKKIKYEKPKSMDIGKVAPVLGLSCSVGTSAGDGCRDGGSAIPGGCGYGADPSTIPYCPNGSTATSFCSPGTTAGFPGCFPGGTPVQG
jgi:hypothetical protein